MNGRYPVEIDLVRNIRYLIPLLLIGTVRFAAYIHLNMPTKYRPILWFLIIVVMLRWFVAFPTTVTKLVVPKLIRHYYVEDSVNNQAYRNLLNYIKKLP